MSTFIPRFAFWNPGTWSIPSLYWDAFSDEQRIHAICKQLGKVIAYADFLGTNVDDIADRLKAIEEGQLDPIIVEAIEEWFNENQPEIMAALQSLNDALPIDEFDAENTVKDALDAINANFPIDTGVIADDAVTTAKIADGAITKKKLASDIFRSVICVDDFGAIGDGVTDNTQIIQNVIDTHPNSQIMFREGVYIVTDTLLVPGDTSSVNIDLNGCTLKYDGSFIEWSEGDAITYRTDYPLIPINPNPVIAIVRTGGTIASACSIENGVIDCNFKAHIGIMNRAYVSSFRNLRIGNFMFAGLFNGSFTSNISSQTMIDSCYFTRGDDWSTRETSAMYFTSYDNNISNCVTNRTKYGITFRCGGNYVSNCHFTIQYQSLPNPYTGASIRIYPENLGMTQVNRISNCYFNAGKYVCYTYNGGITGTTNLRTFFNDCDYIFYSSDDYHDLYGATLELAWYGGELNGIWTAKDCSLIFGDYTHFLRELVPNVGSYFVARAKEMNIINSMQGLQNCPFTSMQYVTNNGETICGSSASAVIPAQSYRLIARIVTTVPAQTQLIGGDIRYTFTSGNNNLAKHGVITAGSNTYNVANTNDIGSTSIKCYITKNLHQYTKNGVDYFYSDIVLYNPGNSAINARTYMTLECSSPYSVIYALPNAVNFDSGSLKNIFDSLTASNLVEVF